MVAMIKEPLISVIVPVYNVEKYIEKCIKSIQNQTYRNIEIIIIDDGSSDKSGRICDRLAITDQRIKVLHSENHGVAAARNTGIQTASGDYISFVDSDDFLDSDFYEYLISLIKKTDADIAYCAFREIQEGKKTKIKARNKISIVSNKEAIINSLIIRHGFGLVIWNGLYKSNIVPFFIEGRIIAEDQDFAIRMLLKSKLVVMGYKQKYNYLQRGTGSKSVNFEKRMNDTLAALESISSILPKDDKEITKAYNIRGMKTYIRLMDNYITSYHQDNNIFYYLRDGITKFSKLSFKSYLGTFLSLCLKANEKTYRIIFFLYKKWNK